MQVIKQVPDEPKAPTPSLQRACEDCQAPLADEQRYCVRCGRRQTDAYDPAARYFADSTRRRRPAAPRPPRRSSGSASSRWAALFLALLPVAVALGVLVGNGNDDQDKLIDALKTRSGTAVAATAGPSTAQTTTASASAGGALPSDFPLDKGYAVQVGTLPLRSTGAAAAKEAEAAAKAKAGEKVGLINPRQFTVKPSPGADKYVLYAGGSKDRGAAEALLRKVKKKVADARVVAVESVNGADGQGKVLSKSSLGTAHQVTGFKPTQEKIKKDTQLVHDINRRTGQTYVQSQRGLPDQIVVGGDPGSAPAPADGPAGQP